MASSRFDNTVYWGLVGAIVGGAVGSVVSRPGVGAATGLLAGSAGGAFLAGSYFGGSGSSSPSSGLSEDAVFEDDSEFPERLRLDQRIGSRVDPERS